MIICHQLYSRNSAIIAKSSHLQNWKGMCSSIPLKISSHTITEFAILRFIFFPKTYFVFGLSFRQISLHAIPNKAFSDMKNSNICQPTAPLFHTSLGQLSSYFMRHMAPNCCAGQGKKEKPCAIC